MYVHFYETIIDTSNKNAAFAGFNTELHRGRMHLYIINSAKGFKLET